MDSHTALKTDAAGEAFNHRPGCAISSSMMVRGVISDAKHLKVFQVVV